MKKNQFIPMLLFPALSFGQGRLEISGAEIARDRREVRVGFTVEGQEKTPRSDYKAVVAPFLCNGSDTLYLPEAEVVGRRRAARERQERLLRKEAVPQTATAPAGEALHYACTVPYQRWMKEVRLGVRQKIVGCACGVILGDEESVAGAVLYVQPEPKVAPGVVRRPVVKEVNRRWSFGARDMAVYFRVNRAELVPADFGNEAALKEIEAAIVKLMNDRDTRLNHIELWGYASPEGPWSLNRRLAENRAEALRDRLLAGVEGLDSGSFKLFNGEENWDGLRRMVAGSDMEFRDEVLGIIDNAPAEFRKERLQKLRGGRPYRYMLDNFYPELRNACYISVYFDVMEDPAADIIERGVALLNAGDYGGALEVLTDAGDDLRAFNATGVALMMLEREDEARVWFGRALESGDAQDREAAKHNLQQIGN
ncbi:MAG: hypothetical protein LIO68_08180 [Rikenellaceae bacterium]|nr:hypothetical protein [Rikenellaceae bacterium]